MRHMMKLIIMSGKNRGMAVRRLIQEGYDPLEVMAAYRQLQKMGLAPVRKGAHEFRNEFNIDDFEKTQSIREMYQDTRKPLYDQWDTGHSRMLRWPDGLYRSEERRGIFERRTKTPAQIMAGKWSTVPGCADVGGVRTRAEEVAARREVADEFRRRSDG